MPIKEVHYQLITATSGVLKLTSMNSSKMPIQEVRNQLFWQLQAALFIWPLQISFQRMQMQIGIKFGMAVRKWVSNLAWIILANPDNLLSQMRWESDTMRGAHCLSLTSGPAIKFFDQRLEKYFRPDVCTAQMPIFIVQTRGLATFSLVVSPSTLKTNWRV